MYTQKLRSEAHLIQDPNQIKTTNEVQLAQDKINHMNMQQQIYYQQQQ